MSVVWDSKAIIGKSKERFDCLSEIPPLPGQVWDWVSFYNGWLEGRLDMLRQIKEDK